jgi:hypothetical protein
MRFAFRASSRQRLTDCVQVIAEGPRIALYLRVRPVSVTLSPHRERVLAIALALLAFAGG